MQPDVRAERQLQLAEERTDAAYQRTQLAEERTFSAWIRTGLASLATGLAIAKLMSETGPGWLIRTLGVLFVLAGGVMFALAFVAYRAAVRRVHEPLGAGIPVWTAAIMTLVLLIGAALALGLVFLD